MILTLDEICAVKIGYSWSKGNPLIFQIKMYKSDYLTINGKNLDRAAQEIDVEVLIGAESCNVTSLSRSQLTCRPPKEQPAPLNNNDLPLVVVSVWMFFFSFLLYYFCHFCIFRDL